MPHVQNVPETVALRFRDFAVDTISEHNAIAAEHGQVWWGWWNKPAERTPRDVLAAFESTIEETGNPLTVFLVDSGLERLFTARLDQIRVAPGLQENVGMGPPEPALVPEYYRDREWRVWFRFAGAIEEVEKDEIKQYAYSEVSGEEFVDDPHSEVFDSKVVDSIHEMLGRRHRTMYFLRARREGDREGLVELEAPDHPQPFSTAPLASSSSYVVVLSDLHFSESRDEHGFPLRGGVGDPDLLKLLEDDRRSHFEGQAPAAVLIVGDLTWAGSPEQFEFARAFLSQLRSAWDIDWQQFVVIPGNHDITWLGGNGQAGQPAAAEAEAGYRKFLQDTLRYIPGDQLSMGRRFLLGNFVPVDVVAVNSVRLEREEFRGYGYVGMDQLTNAFHEMGWTSERRAEPRVRVLALHHHVVPVVPLEKIGAERYSLTLDAGELLYTCLKHGVDLIVHGHQHKPFAAGFSRPGNTEAQVANRLLPVHGVGSAGVAREHLPDAESNAYSIVHFAGDEMTLEVRARSVHHGHAFAESWTTTLDRTSHGYRARELREE